MTLLEAIDVLEIDLTTESFPRSILFAITTSLRASTVARSPSHVSTSVQGHLSCR